MAIIASKEPTTITKRNNEGIEVVVPNVRVHNAAGKDWKFTRGVDDDGPLTCDVTDPAAVEVFLHERNANTFYAVNKAELTRGEPPADSKKADSKKAAK